MSISEQDYSASLEKEQQDDHAQHEMRISFHGWKGTLLFHCVTNSGYDFQDPYVCESPLFEGDEKTYYSGNLECPR